MYFYILADVSRHSFCFPALEGLQLLAGEAAHSRGPRTNSWQRRLACPPALPQLIRDLSPRAGPGGAGGEAPPVALRAPRPLRGHSAPSRQANLRDTGGTAGPLPPPRRARPLLPAATGGSGRPGLRRPGKGRESRGRPSGGSHPAPRRRGSTHLLGSAGQPEPPAGG